MFGALIPLQPVSWVTQGLICAPRLARDDVTEALRTCPLPIVHVESHAVWPDSPAALVSGWYRRTDHHAPPPAGVRELIQAAGDGFGPADHPTTAMCLAALDMLRPASAVDVGCGSGLLAQAWARLVGQPVLAIDLDPAAVRQTQASAEQAGCGALIAVRRQPIEALAGSDLAGRVVLANIPAAAHHVLVGRLLAPPPAAVLSGLRRDEAASVLDAYLRMGLRHVRATRRGRFECHTLVGTS